MKIRNVSQVALSFRVPGKDVFLRPGEEGRLPESCRSTRELKRLSHRGLVALSEPRVSRSGRKAKSEARPEPATAPAAEPAPSGDRKPEESGAPGEGE